MFQCLLRMLGPSTRTRTILIVTVATYSYPEVFCLLVFTTLRYVLYFSLTIGRLFASLTAIEIHADIAINTYVRYIIDREMSKQHGVRLVVVFPH